MLQDSWKTQSHISQLVFLLGFYIRLYCKILNSTEQEAIKKYAAKK